jgi:hypothetical protein
MLEFFDNNIVIYAGISFLSGAAAMLLYYKVKSQFKANNLANIEVINTIINQYKSKLDQYEGIVNELKIKTELLESKINHKPDKIINHAPNDSTSQQMSQYFKERNELSKPDNIISVSNLDRMNTVEEDFHAGDTLEVILKLLLNGPLTSREIQRGIRKTREHTSRIMKKLYELKYVDRDINHKPFRYNITDLGRLQTHNHPLSDGKSTVYAHD